MNKVELLAPAGSLEKLKIALLYGADAVYIGGEEYSMRANAKNFSLSEIKTAVEYAHGLGKKVYVTVNIVFHNENFDGLVDFLRSLAVYKVDAIIVSDMAVIDIIRQNKIKLDIHVSTQMSNANVESVLFLKDEGVKRVVLARESSKENTKEIIDKTGMEVECFLHGAMCSSYSGRCVLSNYFTNRDANRGACAQVCRWYFDIETEDGKSLSDKKFAMACKDLSLINNLKEMIEIGITSLKVEGRMRSNYYIATVISTYREAIDSYYDNTLDEEKLTYYNKILNRVANRESTSQFFEGIPGIEGQYYTDNLEGSNQDFLGIVLSYDKDKKEVTLSQRNYFKKGDAVEMFGPNIKPFAFVVPDIYDEDGNLVDAARHPEETIRFKLDRVIYPNDIMRVKF